MLVVFQVELHRLLPLFHDDLPNPLRGVDRTAVGLHEGRGKSGETLGLWKIFSVTNDIRLDFCNCYLKDDYKYLYSLEESFALVCCKRHLQVSVCNEIRERRSQSSV